MKLKVKSMPLYCLSGAKLSEGRAKDIFSNLTVCETESLIKTWLVEVLKSMQEPPELIKIYTRAEVAEILGLSTVTLDKLIKEGGIKSRRIGGKILFLNEDIVNALRS